MPIEVKGFCPLGSECETVKDGVIHRCNWFVEIAGQHPQTGEQVNESKCALAWMPILSVEVAMTNRGQTAAIESFRNEMVNENLNTAQILASTFHPRLINGSN